MGYITPAWQMERSLVFHLLRCCEDTSLRRAFFAQAHAALQSATSASTTLGIRQIFRIACDSVPSRTQIHASPCCGGMLNRYIARTETALANLPQLHRQAIAQLLNAEPTDYSGSQGSLLVGSAVETACQQALAAIHLRLLGTSLDESALSTTTRMLEASAWWLRSRITSTDRSETLLRWLLASPSPLQAFLFTALAELLAANPNLAQ